MNGVDTTPIMINVKNKAPTNCLDVFFINVFMITHIGSHCD